MAKGNPAVCGFCPSVLLRVWQVLRNGLVLTNPDPSASAHNCATDADTDVAYALLLAGAPRQACCAGSG